MGSSLLTNRAAMTALQTLRTIGTNMESTQSHVSTGRRINEAADNTAYWAISNSMKSDSDTTSVIKDALHLGKARVDQAYTAAQQVKKELESIKQAVVNASGNSKYTQQQLEIVIQKKLENIKTAVVSGSISGVNLLVQNGKDELSIPGSFRRKGDAICIDKIGIDAARVQLADIGTNGDADFSKGLLSDLFDTKNPIFSVDNKSANTDTKTDTKTDTNTNTKTDTVNKDKPLSNEQIEAIANRVQKVLDHLNTLDTVLGAAKKQIDSQYEFVNRLIDNLDKSVGTLVDADMNAESARLSALQVQQQLAVQALSIANQSTQTLLTLFRQ